MRVLSLTVVVTVGLVLALIAPAAAGPWEDAVAADNRGDFATELRLLTPLAEHGSLNAQFGLGLMYFSGEGVARDYRRGFSLIRKSADQGLPEAQMAVGGIYSVGFPALGLPQDKAGALRWYRKAVDQGNAETQLELGLMYFLGKGGVPVDYSQAALWLRKAADQGNGKAQFSLGAMYVDGHGVPQDYAQAVMWFRKAADQGSADAKAALAALKDKPTSANAKPVPSQTAVPAAPASAPQPTAAPTTSPSNVTEVALEAYGGVFRIPVLINDSIKLDFVIDSGSADVVITSDVFETLNRTGTVTNEDLGDIRSYTMADGHTSQSKAFRIRSLKVGDKVFENVAGSVSDTNDPSAPLLLGQTFLSHYFKSWSVDNSRHVLILTPNSGDVEPATTENTFSETAPKSGH